MVARLEPEPGAHRDVIVPVQSSEPETAQPIEVSSGVPNPAREDRFQSEIIPPPQHRFHFTADAELLQMVDRLRGLLRHKIPDGRLEGIFKEAAKTLLAKIDHDKAVLYLQPKKRSGPSPSSSERRGSRFVPRTIKREVWTRDGGRCAYAAPDGRRCESHEALEYDHIVAWADGGRSDTPDNIRLLCRAHNQRLGRRRFGVRGR